MIHSGFPEIRRIPKQFWGSQQGPPGPTKQGPCLAQPRQVRSLKMMKYHFFRRLRPCSGTTRHTGAKTQTKYAVSVHNVRCLCWSGEARARHVMRISCVGAGAGWAVLSSVRVRACVQQGVPLKIRLFPKIPCSYSPCSGVKCCVLPNKHVNEKISYQIFPRTPL